MSFRWSDHLKWSRHIPWNWTPITEFDEITLGGWSSQLLSMSDDTIPGVRAGSDTDLVASTALSQKQGIITSEPSKSTVSTNSKHSQGVAVR